MRHRPACGRRSPLRQHEREVEIAHTELSGRTGVRCKRNHGAIGLQVVRRLNAAISQFRPPQGQGVTNEDREKLRSNIPAFEAQLALLIEELQDLRDSARDSRMKTLEKNAESLAQSLQAARKKLGGLSPLKTDGIGGQN